MASNDNGDFGPNTVRRMGRAYRYAHDIAEQREPQIVNRPDIEQELARGIVEGAKSDKQLPRRLVRSLVDRVLGQAGKP